MDEPRDQDRNVWHSAVSVYSAGKKALYICIYVSNWAERHVYIGSVTIQSFVLRSGGNARRSELLILVRIYSLDNHDNIVTKKYRPPL